MAFFFAMTSSAVANIPLSCDDSFNTEYLNSPVAKNCPKEHGVCYDIVYIRYPQGSEKYPFVKISRGEHPYEIAKGADLMLLHPDGNEKILVDCDDSCSITDPTISFDGKTVYFVRVNSALNKRFSFPKKFYSRIYKMALTGEQAFKPIQLTFNDGYDSKKYAGYKDYKDDLSYYTGIIDLAPIPLSDGRILFTSNRAALIPFHPGH